MGDCRYVKKEVTKYRDEQKCDTVTEQECSLSRKQSVTLLLTLSVTLLMIKCVIQSLRRCAQLLLKLNAVLMSMERRSVGMSHVKNAGMKLDKFVSMFLQPSVKMCPGRSAGRS